MAEVEKAPTALAAVVGSTTTITATSTSPTPDIPTAKGTRDDGGGGGASSDAVLANNDAGSGGGGGENSAIEMGTSPTQERSSNSHPHDSEYDTASDLEGGDDYDDDDELDDDDDEDDDSLIDDEDDDDDEEDEDLDDDDIDSHQAGISVGAGVGEKFGGVDAEAQKKVDEDRSNPQYIPKRGTFYEHDDRTAEENVIAIAGESSEPQDGVSGVGGADGVRSGAFAKPQSPTIAQASKTMKKWQPASAVERWSHDRFDAGEQAPKSRSELVSAYGYDIRTEDAPPRARRRRRYGHGPSKYVRNWEDETAYLKASNKERKPPRKSDFPALNERGPRMRKPQTTPNHREEKENRVSSNRTNSTEPSVNANDNLPRSGISYSEDRRDLRPELRSNNKSQNYGRSAGASGTKLGRQPAMEFKQKQRNNGSQLNNNRNDSHITDRRIVWSDSRKHDGGSNVGDRLQMHNSKVNNAKTNDNSKQQHNQVQHNESYNNVGGNRLNDISYQQQPQLQQQQQPSMQHHVHINQPQQQQQPLQSAPQHSPDMRLAAMPPSSKNTIAPNLAQRLQQAQNRPDANHVGGAAMHTMPPQSLIIATPQQAVPVPSGGGGSQLQEQRGPIKRYSSLRRTQHEAQHLAEQQQLQQLHMPQQPPPTQAPPLLLQDPHLLQANLMQLYHQDDIPHVQMEGPPQVSGGTGAIPTGTTGKQPACYGTVSAPVGAPTAYYVTAPPQPTDVYATAATVATTAQAPSVTAQYGLPQSDYTNATAAPGTQIVVPVAVPGGTGGVVASPPTYGPAPPQQGAVGGNSATGAIVAGAAPVVGGGGPGPGYGNYHQNYNTVGGTTYFVAQPAQVTTRPNALPQRRPTNAIPILPPSDNNKTGKTSRTTDGTKDVSDSGNKSNVTAGPVSGEVSNAPIGSAENIDHIIDNMFVQRPAFQPPAPSSTVATGATSLTGKSNSPPVHEGNNNQQSASTVNNETMNNITGNNSDDSNKLSTTIDQQINNNSSGSDTAGGTGGSITSTDNTNTTNPIAVQE